MNSRDIFVSAICYVGVCWVGQVSETTAAVTNGLANGVLFNSALGVGVGVGATGVGVVGFTTGFAD